MALRPGREKPEDEEVEPIPEQHIGDQYDYNGPSKRESERVNVRPVRLQMDDASEPVAWRHKGGTPGKSGGY